MEGEWSCLIGQFNGVKMVLLQKRSLVHWRENGMLWRLPFMEGEWPCYGGGHFNGGRMVICT